MEKTREQLTVVFLGDKQPPTKLILLKRASKRWAGEMYTGIGGHKELGEDIETAALRELDEETGVKGVELIEFARCIIDGISLHYFWGAWDNNQLPVCNEGDLEWVKAGDLLSKDIIPTTLTIIQEWQNRRFVVDYPWTMYLSGEVDPKGVVRNVVINSVKEELVPLESN